ncbi:hypothetical protein, partial [Dyella sp.]|uniref:hypothetical protein n=1 Tax=Dyella sp. TaxID=1869338 RepID=UPI002ED113D9
MFPFQNKRKLTQAIVALSLLLPAGSALAAAPCISLGSAPGFANPTYYMPASIQVLPSQSIGTVLFRGQATVGGWTYADCILIGKSPQSDVISLPGPPLLNNVFPIDRYLGVRVATNGAPFTRQGRNYDIKGPGKKSFSTFNITFEYIKLEQPRGTVRYAGVSAYSFFQSKSGTAYVWDVKSSNGFSLVGVVP